MENQETITLTPEQLSYVRSIEAEVAREQHHIEALNMAKQMFCVQIVKAAGITDGQFKIDSEAGTITKGA